MGASNLNSSAKMRVANVIIATDRVERTLRRTFATLFFIVQHFCPFVPNESSHDTMI
jgi:hypothetical protein